MGVKIRSAARSFRRLGIAFSHKEQTFSDDKFSAKEMEILKNDPNLVVIAVPEKKAGINPATTKAETKPATTKNTTKKGGK